MIRNIKDNLLRFIEMYSGKIHNWAWDKRWKERAPETWIQGYNKHKKSYDQWKEDNEI